MADLRDTRHSIAGHEGSTVLVCLNGLRLLVYKPRLVSKK